MSVYFDTRKLKLRKRGMSLRVRRVGEHHVQTIRRSRSSAGSGLDRDEWECDVEHETPDLEAARGTPLDPLLTGKLRRSLGPVFETRVVRTVYPIKRGGSEIELSVDQGVVQDGRRSSTICEAELELVHGHAAQLFAVARDLAKCVPLEIGVGSKADRGYALLTGERPQPVKSLPTELGPDLHTQSAFKIIARGCLRQLIANLPAMRVNHPEGLHQARVALRRLRAAISLFSTLMRDEQSERIKRELKWVTGELGPARELDVFLNRVMSPLVERHGDDTSLRRLDADLLRQHTDAFRGAHAVVDGGRFRKLVLDTATWIEIGEWAQHEDDLKRILREQPIVKTAYEELDRRWRKILKRGKRLASLDARRLHKLRIAAKKLRYAAEFFEHVFLGKKEARRRTRFVGALKTLQSALGELNDIRVNIEVTRHLADRRSCRSNNPSSRAFVAGRLSGREEARRSAILEESQAAFDRFRDVKPYWK